MNNQDISLFDNILLEYENQGVLYKYYLESDFHVLPKMCSCSVVLKIILLFIISNSVIKRREHLYV